MIQQIITFMACLTIIALTEPTINRMGCRSPLLLRLGFWGLCVAALAAVVNILLGEVPPWAAVCGASGAACYLLGERRRLARHKWQRPRHDHA